MLYVILIRYALTQNLKNNFKKYRSDGVLFYKNLYKYARINFQQKIA